jgi:predicted membrane-bound spermidine synthase
VSKSPNTTKASATTDGVHYREPSTRTVHLVLGAICFLAGAAVMVIEISAFRLLAPLFGNTAYTWTALIGVILIAFSVGGFSVVGSRIVNWRWISSAGFWAVPRCSRFSFLR